MGLSLKTVSRHENPPNWILYCNMWAQCIINHQPWWTVKSVPNRSKDLSWRAGSVDLAICPRREACGSSEHQHRLPRRSSSCFSSTAALYLNLDQHTPNLTHVWNKERRSWTLMHVSGPTHTPSHSHRRMLAQLCIMFLHSNIYSLEVVLLRHKRPIEQHILLSMALIGSALHIYDYQHYSSYRVKSCNV